MKFCVSSSKQHSFSRWFRGIIGSRLFYIKTNRWAQTWYAGNSPTQGEGNFKLVNGAEKKLQTQSNFRLCQTSFCSCFCSMIVVSFFLHRQSRMAFFALWCAVSTSSWLLFCTHYLMMFTFLNFDKIFKQARMGSINERSNREISAHFGLENQNPGTHIEILCIVSTLYTYWLFQIKECHIPISVYDFYTNWLHNF